MLKKITISHPQLETEETEFIRGEKSEIIDYLVNLGYDKKDLEDAFESYDFFQIPKKTCDFIIMTPQVDEKKFRETLLPNLKFIDGNLEKILSTIF